MSVNIKLYKTTSNPLQLNRDTGSVVFNADGNFIEPVDILHPTFKISGNSSILSADLVYISAFGNRYYFIDKIIPVTEDIFEIHCLGVDVLKTYASSIKSSKALVVRSESDFNYMYNDGTLKTREDIELFVKNYGIFGGGGDNSVKYLLCCI